MYIFGGEGLCLILGLGPGLQHNVSNFTLDWHTRLAVDFKFQSTNTFLQTEHLMLPILSGDKDPVRLRSTKCKHKIFKCKLVLTGE